LSHPVVAKQSQAAEKPKNTGTIDGFFGKSVHKKPTAYKKPSTIGGQNFAQT
jgi:hypothetical protein